LERPLHRYGDPLQREHKPERLLRGGGLLLGDRDDDLLGFADSLLSVHDGSVHVAAGVLGAIGPFARKSGAIRVAARAASYGRKVATQ
jgi:hypothetical protein